MITVYATFEIFFRSIYIPEVRYFHFHAYTLTKNQLFRIALYKAFVFNVAL